MDKKYNIAINKIKTHEEVSLSQLHSIFKETLFVEDIGYGIINSYIEENQLYSTYLQRKPVAINKYDLVKDEFIQETVFVYEKIPFILDNNYSIFYTFGQIKNINQIKSFFRNVFEFKYETSNVQIEPVRIVNYLRENKISYEITELSINNFSPNEGAYGKFTPKITNQQIGLELIEKYKNDIQRMHITIDFNIIKDIKISFLNNGGIAFQVEEDYFEDVLNKLKTIIFEK